MASQQQRERRQQIIRSGYVNTMRAIGVRALRALLYLFAHILVYVAYQRVMRARLGSLVSVSRVRCLWAYKNVCSLYMHAHILQVYTAIYVCIEYTPSIRRGVESESAASAAAAAARKRRCDAHEPQSPSPIRQSCVRRGHDSDITHTQKGTRAQQAKIQNTTHTHKKLACMHAHINIHIHISIHSVY